MMVPDRINKLGYNTIPEQRLTYANQLTVREWNVIINSLRTQTNAITEYLKRIHEWLFTEGIGWYDTVNYYMYVTNSLAERTTILETKMETALLRIETEDYVIAEVDK